MIFGQLLTGSNYDDDEERLTSGRNGLGIKLTNVFSSEFNVEIYDENTGQLYKKIVGEQHERFEKRTYFSSERKKRIYESDHGLPILTSSN